MGRVLDDIPSVIALHDREVPGTVANIDHLVIARTGIFVIDTKRLRGRIYLRRMGEGPFGRPHLFSGGRDISDLADKLAWQVEAVERALRHPRIGQRPPVYPILCFVRAAGDRTDPPAFFQGVALERPETLEQRFIGEGGLTDTQVVELAQILDRALPVKRS